MGITIRNIKTNFVKQIMNAALFVAIGTSPNNTFAVEIDLKLDENGFIRSHRYARTNFPRIYRAGDTIGGVLQIVTSVSSKATAVSTAFEDIMHRYWIPNDEISEYV